MSLPTLDRNVLLNGSPRVSNDSERIVPVVCVRRIRDEYV